MKCDMNKECYLYGQMAFFSHRNSEMWKSLSLKIAGIECEAIQLPSSWVDIAIEGIDGWRRLSQGDEPLRTLYQLLTGWDPENFVDSYKRMNMVLTAWGGTTQYFDLPF